VLLVDLQDLGCRIYTFITTLRYVLEAAAAHGKAVWVLDRPNPAGRPVEGTPAASRLGELRRRRPHAHAPRPDPGRAGPLVHRHFKLDVEYRVITMDRLASRRRPRLRLADGRAQWVNPSPNAANLSMARAYAGTVMLEGTTLSEGRGTTRPLELFGAPDIDTTPTAGRHAALAPDWLAGCRLRECWFEPTFHKHAGQLCAGVQIHTEDPAHYDHAAFRPWRLQALAFKALRRCSARLPAVARFSLRIRNDRLAIDLINGGPLLREWVDDPSRPPGDLDALARADEQAWIEAREPFLMYE
jgi:uncharacterized protein YbbC (DUF1343 family)